MRTTRLLLAAFVMCGVLLVPFHVFSQTLQVSDGLSSQPSISFDGDSIAFSSEATDLVENDQNGVADIFLHFQKVLVAIPDPDAQRQTVRVSVSNEGVEANGASHSPAINASTSRFVAFVSAASNLVANDTNGVNDIFVRDRTLSQTYRISVPRDSLGVQSGEANGPSYSPKISADGCYIVFASDASNLQALNSQGIPSADLNGKRDIFLYYNPLGEAGCSGGAAYLELISVGPDGVQANEDSDAPAVSAPRYVSFTSKATNLISNDTNGVADIFLRDRVVELGGADVGRTTLLISVDSSGSQANGESFSSVIDGPDVVFDSTATNLVTTDRNGKRDVFKHRLAGNGREGGETTLVSQTLKGEQGNGDSYAPTVSAGSNYIAFSSDATNLSREQDCNNATDVFVRDFVLGNLRRVNFSTSGYQSENGLHSGAPAIAGGGVVAVYQTLGALSPSDRNGVQDIYLSVASDDPRSLSKPLERGERLDEKPDVCAGKNRAQVTMERFSAVSVGGATSVQANAAFPCKGRGLCYELNAKPVTAGGRPDSKRGTVTRYAKRNELTLKGLQTGKYQISFRVYGKSNSRIVKTNVSPKRTVKVR